MNDFQMYEEGRKEAESKLLNIDNVIVPKGTLYCEKEEWHDWWKIDGGKKECVQCGKIEAI